MVNRSLAFCVCFALSLTGALANEHIDGACLVGESAVAHGRSDADAVVDIRRFAQLYVTQFQKFRKSERDVRARINAILELERWNQADIVAFTKGQRELLYLSVGKQLATGRITADELPEFARTIRQRIMDIEIELGCDVLPGP